MSISLVLCSSQNSLSNKRDIVKEGKYKTRGKRQPAKESTINPEQTEVTLRYSNREVVGGASDEYSTGGKNLANDREEFDSAIKLTNRCRLCTNGRRDYWYGYSERHKFFFNITNKYTEAE